MTAVAGGLEQKRKLIEEYLGCPTVISTADGLSYDFFADAPDGNIAADAAARFNGLFGRNQQPARITTNNRIHIFTGHLDEQAKLEPILVAGSLSDIFGCAVLVSPFDEGYLLNLHMRDAETATSARRFISVVGKAFGKHISLVEHPGSGETFSVISNQFEQMPELLSHLRQGHYKYMTPSHGKKETVVEALQTLFPDGKASAKDVESLGQYTVDFGKGRQDKVSQLRSRIRSIEGLRPEVFSFNATTLFFDANLLHANPDYVTRLAEAFGQETPSRSSEGRSRG